MAADTGCPPMNTENTMVTTIIEAIMPRVRMVLVMPDATPRWRGSTLPTMALALGEANRP